MRPLSALLALAPLAEATLLTAPVARPHRSLIRPAWHARTVPYHVSAEDFERIAVAALDRIPAPLRDRMDADNLLITIQARATVHDRANDIDEHVLGFYEGGEDSVFSAYTYPKRIVLLQGNIERWCESYDELVEQVHDTVLHEVAHYFGMSHADIDQTRLRH